MADNKSKLTIEDYKSDFTIKKKENGLNIPPVRYKRIANWKRSYNKNKDA